ncbi:MAG: alpha-L-arabinofuranosidase [Sphingobacteriaceae bacterium]|nr:MAG: alpha-L-arabinofuranosidase [Sphingobacteriaceae bacterium]
MICYKNAVYAVGFGLFLLNASCKKERTAVTNPPATPTTAMPTTTAVTAPTDPATAASIGFFMDGWLPKTFTAPAYTDVAKPADAATVTISADYSATITKVSKYLFGNNANPYMTQMVTEPVLIDQITRLSPNIIRYPGGNISSIFFWNAAVNQAPADAPAKLVYDGQADSDAGYWFGKNTASYTLSLDNYYQMLQQTGSTGIITINYGYARYGTSTNPVAKAAHLAADWVRYDKGRTKYWEIGNESYGNWQAGFKINLTNNKDGQPETETGALYGQHFKVFADSMRKAATEINSNIKIGGQLLEYDATTSSTAVYKSWNSGFFTQAGNTADYFIVHNYYTPYLQNTNALDILNTATTSSASVINYIKSVTQTSNITLKPIALTEWNIFAEGSKQMVSHVAGMHAAMVLGELIKNQYGMASRWDLANAYESGNDHGMFSQGDENDGTTRWTPRPAFYQMYYFQKYFGDRMVSSNVTGNANVVSYVSGFSSGEAGVVLVNKGTSTLTTTVTLSNFNAGSRYYYYVLTGGNDNGSFSRKEYINGNGPTGVSGGPANYTTIQANAAAISGGIKVSLPPLSVVYLVAEGKK